MRQTGKGWRRKAGYTRKRKKKRAGADQWIKRWYAKSEKETIGRNAGNGTAAHVIDFSGTMPS
jgi:hypothetical protein